MPVVIRPGNGAADQASAITLFSRHLNPAYDTERFDWLYRRNPAGSGRLWIAEDSGTGEIVGTAGAFPRLFSIDGEDVQGWTLGDFCVAERYRALGPALKLQRACLAPEPGAIDTFRYDFPSDAMMTVYRRLGIAPVGQLRRFVKLLRVDRALERVTPWPVLNLPIQGALNALLRLHDLPTRRPRGVALAIHDGPFGEEFSRLFDAQRAQYGICAKRTAEFLEWRYGQNPVEAHSTLTARRLGRLIGYAVFTRRGDAAAISDLFGVPEPEVLRGLVRRVAAIARERGDTNLSMSILDTHPWAEMLRGLGFVAREGHPLIWCVGESADRRATDRKLDHGLFMSGDRDS
ncbi:MAG TPA: hypothetical protein VJX92_21240 [Methylomirabilota bacterium]|nr:hypothetical protein [Methylomirabilota bacterium]